MAKLINKIMKNVTDSHPGLAFRGVAGIDKPLVAAEVLLVGGQKPWGLLAMQMADGCAGVGRVHGIHII